MFADPESRYMQTDMRYEPVEAKIPEAKLGCCQLTEENRPYRSNAWTDTHAGEHVQITLKMRSRCHTQRTESMSFEDPYRGRARAVGRGGRARRCHNGHVARRFHVAPFHVAPFCSRAGPDPCRARTITIRSRALIFVAIPRHTGPLPTRLQVHF